ncbi:response regulator transcription factor [Candidatus Uhrbacteria bacterium]|nr:response regulator transcription factor [Candidatus Uhrbacteria bacterium]
MRALMIEGDKFLSEICERVFREAGIEFFRALHGEEGLSSALKYRPDLIILAIILPRKDGFQVLDELKEHPETKEIPVIIFSDLGTKEDIDRCFNSGACEYLIKAHHTTEELLARAKAMMKVYT